MNSNQQDILKDQRLLFANNPIVETFDNFFGKKNKQIIKKVTNFIFDETSIMAWVYAAEQSGKTHFLKACCQYIKLYNEHPDHTGQCLYLNFSQLNIELINQIFNTINAFEENVLSLDMNSDNAIFLIAVDDIRELELSSNSGNIHQHEIALLSLYENIKASRNKSNIKMKLVCASQKPPNLLNLHHKDLQTRMSTSIVYAIQDLDDDEKKEYLKYLANQKGLFLTDEHIKYISNHFTRKLNHLITLINELDTLSLKNQKKVSIPLIKMIIAKLKNS